MCGTSKSGAMSLRDIGCCTTTLPFSAASARAPWTAGTKSPGTLRRRREERVAVEARHQELRDPRHEALAVAQREDVDERGERGRVHPRDVAADEQERVPLVASLAPHRDPGLLERAQDVDDVHLPGERPRQEAEIGKRRPALEGHRGLPLLVEEPLAHDIGNPVEEPVDPLEAQVRHPDLVGVREPEGQPVGAEAVRLLGEALAGRALAVDGRGRHEKQRIIGAAAGSPRVGEPSRP